MQIVQILTSVLGTTFLHRYERGRPYNPCLDTPSHFSCTGPDTKILAYMAPP